MGNKNVFKVVREDKNSEVVVITPLLKGHRISKDTKKTINRNKVPFTWIHSIGTNNIPKNVEIGLNHYLTKMKGKAKYLLPLDRDIILGRSMIDRMKVSLDNSDDRTAYTYANFKFQGEVNIAFDAKPFDIESLLHNNYISSNSMIKISALKEIGGFVVDGQYKRLLDWCLWLKFLENEYFGKSCPRASFIAISGKNDISSGNNDDFNLKRKRVFQSFVKPIIDRFVKANESKPASDETELLTFGDEF